MMNTTPSPASPATPRHKPTPNQAQLRGSIGDINRQAAEGFERIASLAKACALLHESGKHPLKVRTLLELLEELADANMDHVDARAETAIARCMGEVH